MLSLAFESLSFRERFLTTAALVSVLFMVYLSFWYEPLRRSMIEQQQTGLRSEAISAEALPTKVATFIKLEQALAEAGSVASWLDSVLVQPSFKGLTGFDYLGSIELASTSTSSRPLYAHSFNLKLNASASQLSVISAFLLRHGNIEVTKLVWSDDAMAGEDEGELLLGVRVFTAQAQAFSAVSSNQDKELM